MADDMDVWVDYHDTDEEGRVLTLRRFFLSESAAVAGTRVLTGDYEGNRCEGTVIEVQPNDVVVIELDEDTLVHSGRHAPVDR